MKFTALAHGFKARFAAISTFQAVFHFFALLPSDNFHSGAVPADVGNKPPPDHFAKRVRFSNLFPEKVLPHFRKHYLDVLF